MFGIGEEVEVNGIDPRVLAFGDTFAVITKPADFIERLSEAAQDMGQDIVHRRVRYFDESEYHGTVGPFVKAANYSYQSEFRICMQPGLGHATALQIGDIRDIAISGRSEGLSKRMCFTHPSS
jgi:hypothetical protein